MTDLTGSGQPVVLGSNYRIRAPGIVGQASLVLQRSITGTTRSTTRAQERPALDRALASQEMQDVATIDVSVTRQVAPPPGALLRAPSGDDALELEIPAPGAGQDALVIAVDESGAITWNFPLTQEGAIAPPTTRGPGATLKFRVSRAPAVAPARPSGTRSIFGAVGKKILKVLVYPVTDRLVGPLVDTFAGKWEAKNRPYRFRTMTPENYASAEVPALSAGDPEWQRLSAGRALLFVHGTTSSAHAAFSGLSPDDVKALSDAYGGRLFAFDHFTLSHGPPRNIEEFARMLPGGVPLDVDIVCHSRGGLVSREIVERGATYGLDGRIAVKQVVFVGVPNAGTALAQPDHMMHMIDRLTTAIDVLPDGPATWILEGIITAVKVIGHGGLTSLDGLASMDPKGQYLTDLAMGPGKATYRGITADFEPKGTPFDRLALKQVVGNRVVDRIFEDAANDLVVPTEGVGIASGGCFPIPVTDMLALGADAGVTHTTYFGNPTVRAHLRQWLNG